MKTLDKNMNVTTKSFLKKYNAVAMMSDELSMSFVQFYIQTHLPLLAVLLRLARVVRQVWWWALKQNSQKKSEI